MFHIVTMQDDMTGSRPCVPPLNHKTTSAEAAPVVAWEVQAPLQIATWVSLEEPEGDEVGGSSCRSEVLFSSGHHTRRQSLAVIVSLEIDNRSDLASSVCTIALKFYSSVSDD